MLQLSRKEIEIIGNSVLADFYGKPVGDLCQTDIDNFARDYLGLQTSFRKLSDDGKILGLTTFEGTDLLLYHDGREEHVLLQEDTVLIEEMLLDDKALGRKRFTIAHECAHQVLFRIEEKREGVSFRRLIQPGRTYSCRDLIKITDWYEWQANVLGAVLLMPAELIKHCLYTFGCTDKLTVYGMDRLYGKDFIAACNICTFLGVSFSAFMIRLKELNLLDIKPASEYHNPLDIFVS